MLTPREIRALEALNSRPNEFLIKAELPALTGAVTLGWLMELGFIKARRTGKLAFRITASGQRALAREAEPVVKRKPGRPPRTVKV